MVKRNHLYLTRDRSLVWVDHIHTVPVTYTVLGLCWEARGRFKMHLSWTRGGSYYRGAWEHELDLMEDLGHAGEIFRRVRPPCLRDITLHKDLLRLSASTQEVLFQ